MKTGWQLLMVVFRHVMLASNTPIAQGMDWICFIQIHKTSYKWQTDTPVDENSLLAGFACNGYWILQCWLKWYNFKSAISIRLSMQNKRRISVSETRDRKEFKRSVLFCAENIYILKASIRRVFQANVQHQTGMCCLAGFFFLKRPWK